MLHIETVFLVDDRCGILASQTRHLFLDVLAILQ